MAIVDSLGVDPLGHTATEMRNFPASVALLNGPQRRFIGDLCVAVADDSTMAGRPLAVRVYQTPDPSDSSTWIIMFTSQLCADRAEAEQVLVTTTAILTGVMRLRR